MKKYRKTINKMNILKQEKGSITVLVLSSLLFFVVFFVNLYMSGQNKVSSQEKEIEQIQKAYDASDADMELEYGKAIEGSTNFKLTDTANTKPASAMPSGATVIEADPSKGIVIKDSKNNEWVWIEVPKSIYTNATYTVGNSGNSVTSSTDYTGIYNVLNEYAKTYREGKAGQGCYWTDEWYDKYGTIYDGTNEYSQVKYITDSDKHNEAKAYYGKIYTDRGTTESTSYASETTYYAKITEKITDTIGCGLTYDQYQKTYKKMLSSVYANGGFWIGRYEAGVSNTTPRTGEGAITGLEAKSQKDMYPFNWVTCSQAQTLANAMSTDSSKTSSLIFGIQWDLVCKFLEGKDGLVTADINSDSYSWGNYANSQIKNLSGKYAIRSQTSPWPLGAWNPIPDGYTKTNSGTESWVLLSTGASEYTKKMNIYDFAGNEWEWTLEHATSRTDDPCSIRGGSHDCLSSGNPVSWRDCRKTSSGSRNYICFRAVLY